MFFGFPRNSLSWDNPTLEDNKHKKKKLKVMIKLQNLKKK